MWQEKDSYEGSHDMVLYSSTISILGGIKVFNIVWVRGLHCHVERILTKSYTRNNYDNNLNNIILIIFLPFIFKWSNYNSLSTWHHNFVHILYISIHCYTAEHLCLHICQIFIFSTKYHGCHQCSLLELTPLNIFQNKINWSYES